MADRTGRRRKRVRLQRIDGDGVWHDLMLPVVWAEVQPEGGERYRLILNRHPEIVGMQDSDPKLRAVLEDRLGDRVLFVEDAYESVVDWELTLLATGQGVPVVDLAHGVTERKTWPEPEA